MVDHWDGGGAELLRGGVAMRAAATATMIPERLTVGSAASEVSPLQPGLGGAARTVAWMLTATNRCDVPRRTGAWAGR